VLTIRPANEFLSSVRALAFQHFTLQTLVSQKPRYLVRPYTDPREEPTELLAHGRQHRLVQEKLCDYVTARRFLLLGIGAQRGTTGRLPADQVELIEAPASGENMLSTATKRQTPVSRSGQP
jgi:hypothetical protein